MRSSAIELGLLLLLAALLAWGTALERQQQRISDSLIRLHVVAASDSAGDQETKLKVRDAILSALPETLDGAENQKAALEQLERSLPALEDAANETLKTLGSGDRASVTLARELFGSRYYETFSLPGGYYEALRVTIGAGEGKNWWCVVYPQLCLSASCADTESVAVSGGLDPEDAKMVCEGSCSFRFRCIELLENLLGYFRSGGDGIPTSG